MNILYSLLFCYLLLGFSQCTNITAKQAKNQLSDEALLDTVQHRTFRYFWEGAEPNSGLARERIHMTHHQGNCNKTEFPDSIFLR